MLHPPPLDLSSPASPPPCEVPDDAFAAARFADALDADPIGYWDDDLDGEWSGLGAAVAADGSFWAEDDDGFWRQCRGDADFTANFTGLPRDGRGHDPLRVGAHPAAGDRCTGAAGPLPARQDVRAGECGRVVGVAAEGASPILPVDPAGRHRPLRTDTRDGERQRDRSVLLATSAGAGDVPPRLGQRTGGGPDLPRHRGARRPETREPLTPPAWLLPVEPDDDDGRFLRGAMLGAALALLFWIALGIGFAWAGGRL